MDRVNLETQENSIKHNITKEEVFDSFDKYLGEKNLKNLRKITPKEREFLEKKLPSIGNVYFVKGKLSSLKKFKAYFLARCLDKMYETATFMLKEYIEGLTENRDDDDMFYMSADKELIFLYIHGECSGWGNTDNWIATTTIDKVANRRRKGLKTVILSERDFPLLEGSKEFKGSVINLGGAEKAQKAEEVIQKMQNDNISDGKKYE